ncbi:glycosyl transferase [Acetobacter aceti NRIC 0242]|uniref:glycosyltransferase n=1 Tax=Acetobacter aceti TaxID=435 RepID=UPI00022607D0|nr:glycosyltransferase [Acetobacter aceti]GBO81935.1 glycosyl transferase [Acetobacter aceti NRIC 0242]
MVGTEDRTVRIAYIINSVEGGGAALPVPAVTQVMRECGHHVEIFALSRRDGRAIAPMEQDGLRVHVRNGAPGDHLAAFLWLKRQMQVFSPTVIWTSLTRATLMGQLLGAYRRCPVVSWQHSARLKPANARLLRLLRSRTSLWIADSCCVEKMTRETLGIPAKQLACWPIFRADADVPLATPWQPGEPVRIGSLGRLHPVKGYDILCQALTLLRQRNDLPSFEVLIAGEGEERVHLEGLIKRDNLPVRLAGYVEHPKNFLATLHAYVQPSFWEGLCLAAHEAMLAGLPVITSAVGELPFTITGEMGSVVPPRDPQALAGALEKLLHSPDKLAEWGQAGRQRVLERFSAERFDATGRDIVERVEQIVQAHRLR